MLQGHKYLRNPFELLISADPCVSVELRQGDLTLTAGVGDISAPEVIIIHSQSQYCCVVKTRTILTSIHLSCRDSHISTLVWAVAISLSQYYPSPDGSNITCEGHMPINLDDEIIYRGTMVIQGHVCKNVPLGKKKNRQRSTHMSLYTCKTYIHWMYSACNQ